MLILSSNQIGENQNLKHPTKQKQKQYKKEKQTTKIHTPHLSSTRSL